MTIDYSPAPPTPAPRAAPDGLEAVVTGVGPLRLLVVDAKPIVRDGVRALLEAQPGLHVVGQAGDVDDAARCSDEPDVIVTDLALPDGRGAEVIAALRARFPNASVVVLTDVESRAQVDAALAAGASAYVPKRASTDDLLAAIRAAAHGARFVPSALEQSDAGGPRGRGAFDAGLTPPEAEVVRLLVLGHTNAEIAERCAVSLRTVEARRARVLRKLGVRTRAELVRVAPRLGLSDIDLS